LPSLSCTSMGSDIGKWVDAGCAKRPRLSPANDGCSVDRVEKRKSWSCIKGLGSLLVWPRAGSSASSMQVDVNHDGCKRVRTNAANDTNEILSLLGEDEIRCLLLWLDLSTFACAMAPSCRCISELIKLESFDGWLIEIQRLHRVSPWVSKTSFENIVASSYELQTHNYRTSLLGLDRKFIASGCSLVPSESRQPRMEALPPFFECQDETLIYLCKACGSFISPVDFTVGHGVMRHQEPAFIIQPNSSMPFCCGVQHERHMPLSSGTYVLIDLVCPNGNCDNNLGWKYQDCVQEGGRPVPADNRHKIGQFWMFAESLQVVAPPNISSGCAGQDFYYGVHGARF